MIDSKILPESNFIHSFIHTFIHSFKLFPRRLFKSTTTERHSRHSTDTVPEFHDAAPQATVSEGLAQGPCVAARAGVEPTTLRTKGVDSTNAPHTPHTSSDSRIPSNMPVCLSVCLSVCQSVPLSVFLSVCLPVCLIVSLFLCLVYSRNKASSALNENGDISFCLIVSLFLCLVYSRNKASSALNENGDISFISYP